MRYHVKHRITREGYAEGTSMVRLTEGYTTFADIPNILAIKRGVRPEEVVIIFAVLDE